jgi:hypothetical protein
MGIDNLGPDVIATAILARAGCPKLGDGGSLWDHAIRKTYRAEAVRRSLPVRVRVVRRPPTMACAAVACWSGGNILPAEGSTPTAPSLQDQMAGSASEAGQRLRCAISVSVGISRVTCGAADSARLAHEHDVAGAEMRNSHGPALAA